MGIQIHDLNGPLGAEVLGVDAGTPLAPGDLKAINEAFLRRMVLRFRGPAFTPQQLCNFSRQFGEIQPHIAKKYRLPDVPEVVLMINQDEKGNFDKVGAERGVGWHSDLAYDWIPAKATLLHAVAIPDRGGNTRFLNTVMAYDEMPADLKRRVDGRLAAFLQGGRQGLNQGIMATGEQNPYVVHPIIRVHPDTGRKAVYANPYHIHSILGMPRQEGDALLEELFAWCGQDRFVWQQQRQVADTLMWENRCGWHSGTLDYPLDQLRKFYRTTIRGTPTVDRAQADQLLMAMEH